MSDLWHYLFCYAIGIATGALIVWDRMKSRPTISEFLEWEERRKSKEAGHAKEMEQSRGR